MGWGDFHGRALESSLGERVYLGIVQYVMTWRDSTFVLGGRRLGMNTYHGQDGYRVLQALLKISLLAHHQYPCLIE